MLQRLRQRGWSLSDLLLEATMLGVILAYLTPFYMALLYVFKDDRDEFTSRAIDFPAHIYWGNFSKAVKSLDFFHALTNTLIITMSSIILIVLLSVMAAYAISRGKGRLYQFVYVVFLSGILVPYQAIFVPIYMVGSKLGFVNNFLGVILFHTATNLPFAVFMMTSFMKTLPYEIEEAATMDGCSVFRMVSVIVFPMLKPAVVTISVMTSILVWNDYLLSVLFLQKPSLQPITVKLALLFRQYQWDLNVAFTGIIMSSIPILIFFLFTQKYYIKGITAGALKG